MHQDLVYECGKYDRLHIEFIAVIWACRPYEIQHIARGAYYVRNLGTVLFKPPETLEAPTVGSARERHSKPFGLYQLSPATSTPQRCGAREIRNNRL